MIIIIIIFLLLPFMFSDFFKALHGLICDYKYYESVKKLSALSLLATDKFVDNVSRCRHCRPLGDFDVFCKVCFCCCYRHMRLRVQLLVRSFCGKRGSIAPADIRVFEPRFLDWNS
jgi:hypothetical protein